MAPETQHHLGTVLAGVNANSCPYRLNFHCHTICSDGSLTPQDLIWQASELGLEHIAVTDHHSIDAFPQMQAWIAKQDTTRSWPTVWTGIEISAVLCGCLVHVLGLSFRHDDLSLKPYCTGNAAVGEPLQAASVCRAIHTAGGLAILAHPARYRLSHHDLINAAAAIGFDGGETWYDYDMRPEWQPTAIVCDSIERQLNKLGLLHTCGTDTHGLNLRGR